MGQKRIDWLAEILHIHDDLERYFEEEAGVAYHSPRTWAPAVDLFETEEHIYLNAEMPGVMEKNLRIEIEGDILTIQGQRPIREGVVEEDFIFVERSYGPFQRTFRLPTPILEQDLEASFRQGVLRMKMRKDVSPASSKIRLIITKIG